MRTRTAVILFTMFLLVSCSSTPRTTMPSPASRVYHGTASVGDFMNITINSTAGTIDYTDVSNGDKGTVPFTVNSDGTYTLIDPTGNLIAAYEVPSYAMVIQAAKTGPGLNTPALITAVESGPISMATFAGHSYNYMQFRTSSGGLEVGSVTINPQGLGSNSSYWPFGSFNQGNQSGSPFNSGTIDLTQAKPDPSGTFLTVTEQGSGVDYIFGTENGVFAVDSPNGAILGLKKAASKDFDPSFAGTYKAIYYQKNGASTGMNNVETGTPSLGNATLVVTAGGQVTVSDPQGNTIVQATLTPVADAPYLYGSAGELQDPCFGLFTFRVTAAGIQQDVFVTFMDKSMLFASFSASLSLGQMGTYDYLYGVALK
ncbi:MAG TPA: hypothetical protein VNX26_10235 [Candidatus Acidoferrum sp.]|jgi:hypothetical protein|nr:hypothetical protein [Candidatus Acidoferrum sp.]